MRVATISLGLLLLSTNASAQAPCSPPAETYDPYKPSHVAIVRQYGGAVLSQAPLSELLKLDPYVPSQAALLRQVGNGIPLWTPYAWPMGISVAVPANTPAECSPTSATLNSASLDSPRTEPLTKVADVVSALPSRATLASSGETIRTPAPQGPQGRVAGVSLQYAGRTWVSAGAAVPLRAADFTRIGESAGLPVYRRTAAKDDAIFVPTTSGMVAPFRMSR